MLAVAAVRVDRVAVHADSSGAHIGAVRGVDEEFLELICADEELLRAEFDAIVAREWEGSLPPAEPPVPSPGTGPQPRRHGLSRGCQSSPGAPRHPGADGWGRQRSPPRLTGAREAIRDRTTTLTTPLTTPR
jgi:hypothetical protein